MNFSLTLHRHSASSSIEYLNCCIKSLGFLSSFFPCKTILHATRHIQRDSYTQCMLKRRIQLKCIHRHRIYTCFVCNEDGREGILFFPFFFAYWNKRNGWMKNELSTINVKRKNWTYFIKCKNCKNWIASESIVQVQMNIRYIVSFHCSVEDVVFFASTKKKKKKRKTKYTLFKRFQTFSRWNENASDQLNIEMWNLKRRAQSSICLAVRLMVYEMQMSFAVKIIFFFFQFAAIALSLRYYYIFRQHMICSCVDKDEIIINQRRVNYA